MLIYSHCLLNTDLPPSKMLLKKTSLSRKNEKNGTISGKKSESCAQCRKRREGYLLKCGG